MFYSNAPDIDHKPLPPPLAPKPRTKPNSSNVSVATCAVSPAGASGMGPLEYGRSSEFSHSPPVAVSPEPMFSLQAMHVASGFHPMSHTRHAAHVAGWGMQQQQCLSPFAAQQQTPAAGLWSAPSPALATLESRGAPGSMGLSKAGMVQNHPTTQFGGGIEDGASPHVAFRFEKSQHSIAPLQPDPTTESTAERRLFCESSPQPQDSVGTEDKRALLLGTTAATGVGWTAQQPAGGITVIPRRNTLDYSEEPELKPAPCIAIALGVISSVLCLWACGLPALLLALIVSIMRSQKSREITLMKALNHSAFLIGAIGLFSAVLFWIMALLLFGWSGMFISQFVQHTYVSPCYSTNNYAYDCRTMLSKRDASTACCCPLSVPNTLQATCTVDGVPHASDVCENKCGL